MASYNKAKMKQVGKSGDWRSLGLPSLRDIEYDLPMPKTRIADAYRRLRVGETVLNPFGEMLFVDRRTLAHLAKTGRRPSELSVRMAELDAAEETVRNPHEIWRGTQKSRRIYIRMVSLPSGGKVINAVDETNHVLSWHSNAVQYDYWRKGTLLYLRA